MARGSVNKVILIGNIGNDPEIKTTPSGVAVANISLATSESWVDKTSGEKAEKTEWHQLVLWRKLAEIVGQYLKKGAKIYVEGKLQTRSWDDKDGNKKYTTEIVVDQMEMLGSIDGSAKPAEPTTVAPAAVPHDGGGSRTDDLPF